MRIGEGTIEEIKDDGLAKVRISRDHLDVACPACFGAERVFLLARNPIAAQEGQEVRYEIADGPLAMGAFMCFIVPLVLLVIGAIMGHLLSSDGLGLTLGGAVIGVLIGAAVTRQYDRSLGKRVDLQATITNVIVPEKDEE